MRTIKRIPPYMRLYAMGWLLYLVNYLPRYNYAAAMVAIGAAEGYGPDQLGLTASVLAATYGGGQLISGWMGERLNPKVMIGVGVLGAAASNVGMALSHSLAFMRAAWGVNGLCCALIWAPMVRLLTVYMPADRLRKAILSFSYATALGLTATYLLTSVLIAHFSWRTAFWVPAGCSLLTFIGWVAVSATAGRTLPKPALANRTASPPIRSPRPAQRTIYWRSGLPLILAAIIAMGILKDGVLTWVPQILTDTFQMKASVSVFLSAVLPLVNVSSVWVVRGLEDRLNGDDMRAAGLLFAGSGIGLLLLIVGGGWHPGFTLLLFSLVSSLMAGANAILVSFVPLSFAKTGRAATVAGLTNAFTYLGGALSGWGLGWLAGAYGWNAANAGLLVLGWLGGLACFLARPAWRRIQSVSKQK